MSLTAMCDFCKYNPFRFSAEYADEILGLVYYNYRHLDTYCSQWITRDYFGNNLAGLYRFGRNSPHNGYDVLGNDWENLSGVCPLFTYNGRDCGGIVPQILDTLPSICEKCSDVVDEFSHELQRNSFTRCCNGVKYDTRTHCCENEKVVEKVSVWVGSRPLDNGFSKKNNIWYVPHTYYLCNDPSNPDFSTGETNPEYGKEPKSPKWWPEPISMIFSIGQVKGKRCWNCDNEVLQYDGTSMRERKVCPSEKEKLCSDHTTFLPYIFLPPFNCWSYTWGISL